MRPDWPRVATEGERKSERKERGEREKERRIECFGMKSGMWSDGLDMRG